MNTARMFSYILDTPTYHGGMYNVHNIRLATVKLNLKLTFVRGFSYSTGTVAVKMHLKE